MARPRGRFFENQVRTYNTIRGIASQYVCFAKTKTLAKRIGVSERQLYRYLKALKDEGMIVTSTKRRYNFTEKTFSSIRYMMPHPDKAPYGREDFTIREANNYSKPINKYSVVGKYHPVAEIKPKVEPPIPIIKEYVAPVYFNVNKVAPPPPLNPKKISLNPTIDEVLSISCNEDLIPNGVTFVSGFERECWFAYINQIIADNMPAIKVKQHISRVEWEINVKCVKERAEKALAIYAK